MMALVVRIALLVLMLLMQLLVICAHHKIHGVPVYGVRVRMAGMSLLSCDQIIIVLRRHRLFLVRAHLARNLEVTLSLEAGSVFRM